MGATIGWAIAAIMTITAAVLASANATARAEVRRSDAAARSMSARLGRALDAEAIALSRADRHATVSRTIRHRVQRVHGRNGEARWVEPTIEDLELMPTRPFSVAATLVER